MFFKVRGGPLMMSFAKGGGGWVNKKVMFFQIFDDNRGGGEVSQKVPMHDISREVWGSGSKLTKKDPMLDHFLLSCII